MAADDEFPDEDPRKMTPKSAERMPHIRDFSTKYLAVLFAVLGATLGLAGLVTAALYSVWDADATMLLWGGAVTLIGALVLYATHLGGD
jgi:hypothetical protein